MRKLIYINLLIISLFADRIIWNSIVALFYGEIDINYEHKITSTDAIVFGADWFSNYSGTNIYYTYTTLAYRNFLFENFYYSTGTHFGIFDANNSVWQPYIDLGFKIPGQGDIAIEYFCPIKIGPSSYETIANQYYPNSNMRNILEHFGTQCGFDFRIGFHLEF